MEDDGLWRSAIMNLTYEAESNVNAMVQHTNCQIGRKIE